MVDRGIILQNNLQVSPTMKAQRSGVLMYVDTIVVPKDKPCLEFDIHIQNFKFVSITNLVYEISFQTWHNTSYYE